MHYDMRDAEYLHGWFMDFMYAGEHYRGGYGAAFRYRNSSAIRDIVPPTAALYRTGDVLETHRQRLPALPDHARAEIVPLGPGKLDDRIMELLNDRVAGRQSGWRYRHHKDPPATATEPGYIDIDDQQIAVVTAGNPDRPALLLLFWPWYEPVSDNIRLHTPSLEAEAIHQSLFDALRCGKNYHLIWRAFFATDVLDEMKTLSQPLSVTLSRTHPCPETTLAALAGLPAASCEETSDEWEEVRDVHFGKTGAR